MTNIDGTGDTNLTADDAVNLMPTWGADNTVFFISNRSGTDNVWSLGANKAVIAAGEPFIGLPNAPRTANKTNQRSEQADLGLRQLPRRPGRHRVDLTLPRCSWLTGQERSSEWSARHGRSAK